MHTLPRAPKTRPDIVLDAEHSRQNRPVATDGYGWAVSVQIYLTPDLFSKHYLFFEQIRIFVNLNIQWGT